MLPLANMSGDPEQEFSRRSHRRLITELSRFRDLLVISRIDFVHKGKAVNVQQIAREFGVEYVLEGACARRAIEFA